MFIKIHNYITKYCGLSLFAHSMRSLYYKINNDLKIRLSDHYANASNHNSYITILVNEDRFTVFEAGNIRYDIDTYPKLRRYLSYKVQNERPKYSSVDAIKTILGREEIFDRSKLTSKQNDDLNKALKEDKEDVSRLYAQYVVQNNKMNITSVNTSNIVVKPAYILNHELYTIKVDEKTYQIKSKKWDTFIKTLKEYAPTDKTKLMNVIQYAMK